MRPSSFLDLYRSAADKGVLLILAAFLAIVLSNSPFEGKYQSIIHSMIFGFTLKHFINDFLMAIFFLLVGLEIKKEIISGNLSKPGQVILPVIAASAGVLFPVLIYALLNYEDAEAIRGWAIPAATDIAFALGLYSLCCKGLPISLRVFLTALAIIDDMIAVIIIAIFYSAEISLYYSIAIVVISLTVLVVNKKKQVPLAFYYVAGMALLVAFYNSGIHTSIAGVVLAGLIPFNKDDNNTVFNRFEHQISPWVQYFIIPMFAFANSGFDISISQIFTSNFVIWGVAFGLLIGKVLGVFAFVAILINMKFLQLPSGAGYSQFFGVSLLCGIGFTMSLFIAELSFAHNDVLLNFAKIGIIAGSLLSAIIAAMVFRIIRH